MNGWRAYCVLEEKAEVGAGMGRCLLAWNAEITDSEGVMSDEDSWLEQK